VRTLPAAPGVVFSYRGSRFAAGADGIARLDLDKPAGETELPDVISLPSSTTSRIEFAKWAGKPPDLTATFDLYYAVQLTFVDRLGNAVDPATISRLVIRSSIGQVIEQERIEPVWVHGVRVVSLAGGLEVKDILYGIDEVTVDAANVVNRASQRFAPRETQDWKVELLFYRTSIQLTDVLFGFPISTTVRIESPSGRISRVSSDEKGIVALQPLPRGTYRVTPEHVGLTVTRPVTMSRDSDVHLAVITYLDMAVAAGVPIGIAIVLLLIGRPRILSRLKWRRRQGEAIP
jgi:hypothetical protein